MKYWTKEEEEYLRDNYKTQSKKEMGLQLCRTQRAVQGKCKGLGLKMTSKEKSLLSKKVMGEYFKTSKKWSRKRKDNWMYNRNERRLFELQKLGGKCILCKISDFDVLQFDHINNDGHKYTTSTLSQVEENPHKFQILCANCNTKKETYRRAFERLEKLGIPPF